MRVLVLGAGVIGVTSAYFLHREGHEVTIIERRDGAGLETSWGNGAILHPSSIQPYAGPGMPLKILSMLGREDAALCLRPSALPKMWRWGLDFLKNCTAERHEATARFNLELALANLEAIHAIVDHTGIRYDSVRAATLKVFDDPDAFESACKAHRFMEAAGLAVERLSAQQAVSREPALEQRSVPVVGALHFPQDELGDCHKFTSGLASWLAEQGVRFRFDTAIDGLVARDGRVRAVRTAQGEIEADLVVASLGSFTAPLLAGVGLRAAIYPVKGVSITAPRALWNAPPRHALLEDQRKFAIVPIGERIRIVGTAEITGYDATPQKSRLDAVLKASEAMFPAIRTLGASAEAVPWAGLRPMTPNGRPIIGETPVGGLWINSGHGHMGWTLACGSAARLADLVSGRRSPDPVPVH